MIRITCDVDNGLPGLLFSLSALYWETKEYSFWSRLRITRSRSKGFHVEYLLPETFDSKHDERKREFYLRYKMRDDPQRMFKDYWRRTGARNVLFTDGKGVVWKGWVWDLLEEA